MLPSLYLQDVWATCIHPDDHKAFFDSLSIELFRAPGHQSEFTKIYKVRRRTRCVHFHLHHYCCHSRSRRQCKRLIRGRGKYY